MRVSTYFRAPQRRVIIIRANEAQEESKEFYTPPRRSRVTDYLQSLDSPKFNSEVVDEGEVLAQKSVRFSKFLSHEDLIKETFKGISKESKFRDSMIFNKLEDVLGLMNENDHFESTMKLKLSSDRFMRTK